MTEPNKIVVRASDAVLKAWKPGAPWDLTAEIRDAAGQARAAGTPHVLVILSADGCHGCGILEDQLKHEGAAIEGKAVVLHAFGGNFMAGRYYSSMTVSDATFTTPGVPFSLLFAVEAAALRYRALGLGPFNAPVEKSLARFLEGKSQYVPEAAGVPIHLTRGGATRTLTSREGFQAELTVPL